ncbi:FBD domain [Sesbania bispinosa]|nr:FBD domain [Sesbania bispinosa]
MEEASLDFSPGIEFESYGHFLCDLLRNLFTVRVLTVCSYLLQVIPIGEERWRMRCDMNVRHLIMKTALHEYEFMGITFLLNSCPQLERLTIELGCVKEVFDGKPLFHVNFVRFWIDNARLYKCMTSTLKEVEIKNFRGTWNEIHVLSYFIIGGKVLKKVVINILKEDVAGEGIDVESRRLRIANNMLKAPRGSSDLDISIY